MVRLIHIVAICFMLQACGGSSESISNTRVTSVDHTTAKRQSIGNCWLYAHATWLESLLVSYDGEHRDVSESYWTWWHWYDQILNSNRTEINAGGNWYTSTRIISDHGWVLEKEFIKEEEGVEMSLRQSQAMETINAALQEGGALENEEDRTPEKIREQLDAAFGSNMAEAETLAVKAEDTVLEEKSAEIEGQDPVLVTLFDKLSYGEFSWQMVYFPSVRGEETEVSPRVVERRRDIFKRVFRALNDNKPVVMSVMIDFNGLAKEDQIFRYKEWKTKGMGTQGGHLLVLSDYAVKNVPGVGDIGEGEVEDTLKIKALEGELNYLVSKNSWGKNRPDRGLTDGYTRFGAEYLTKQMEWKAGEDSDVTSWYTTLSNFVLPPGY